MVSQATLYDRAVRIATEDDVDAIARLHTDTWRSTYPDLIDPADAAARERMWSSFLLNSNGTGDLLVADLSGRMAGFIAAGPAWGDKLGAAAEVYAIYVQPELQRKRVGRALMADCAQRLLRRGFRSLGLWVRDTNAEAKSFYQRLGGVPSGSKTELVGGVTVDEIAMLWKDIDRVSELWEEQRAC